MLRISASLERPLLRVVAEGKYRSSVGRVVEFAEVPAALRALGERNAIGRTVVRVASAP